jgi:peptidoglycan-N-acetylglucosamine deacetylase
VTSVLSALVKERVFDHVPRLVRRGPPDVRRVALTFDDGPDERTTEYLAMLDDLGVPATFFLCGDRVDRRPHMIGEYLRRGHQVASHGYDHTRFTKLSRAQLLDQCARTEAALGGQPTGRPWVRPPHGSLDATSTVSLIAAGYTVALWTIDSEDHSDRDIDSLVARCTLNTKPGEVLLFHEGQEWTLAALPRIVEGLRAAQLECVTMFDLFAV